MSLVPVNGPTDLPELRNWLLQRFKPYGDFHAHDGPFVRHALEAGQLWWVEEETCHLLAESAPTWPDDATLDFANIPAKAGLAIFAHDIVGMDAESEDETVLVSGIVWGPVHLPPLNATARQRNGIDPFLEDEGRVALGIGMFSRIDLHKGMRPHDMARMAPMLGAIMGDLFGSNAKPGESLVFTEGGMEGTLYAYVGRTDWLDGWPANKPLPDSPRAYSPQGIASMAEDRKLLAALFALTQSSFVTTVNHRPVRAVARRSERKGLTADVQVMQLGGIHKQNVGWSSPGSKREWQHSWIVGAHFRWQACGPQWKERKLILVSPYLKGDTSKPLLGANRVWRVVPPAGGSK